MAWDQQLAFMAERRELGCSPRSTQLRLKVNSYKAEAIIEANFS